MENLGVLRAFAVNCSAETETLLGTAGACGWAVNDPPATTDGSDRADEDWGNGAIS